MQSYFNPAAYIRAKKNKDELQKSNPQNPVLKDEDEKFLERVTSSEEAARANKNADTTRIADDGGEKEASALDPKDEAVVPETQPKAPHTSEPKEPKTTRDQSMELPSQEEAEALTRGWNEQVKVNDQDNASSGKRTWASYLPTMTSSKKTTGDATTDTSAAESKDKVDDSQQRSWAEYASSYVSSVPVPVSWRKSKDKDSEPELVYNEDGSVNEEKTKEKQEKEISVLLDNLGTTSINDHVFALSTETQKIYERFSQILKDTINGVPTAYDDMDKLMREAGPQLEKQFKSMPPFVQTLVKSLPAKLGTTLAPELLAASSEKPGADMKAAGESSKTAKKKQKRKISGLKSLVKKEGAVAGILRSTVSFIQTRFPFLASATNVVMSLAVFILMFVFWYCHKRGKEVRLAKIEANGPEEDEDDLEVESTDEDEEWERKMNQPHPSEVPLPDEENKEEKAT